MQPNLYHDIPRAPICGEDRLPCDDRSSVLIHNDAIAERVRLEIPPMSTNESLLREFAALPAPPTVTEVHPGTVFHVMGYGHSNATFVITNDSVVVIDTLDSGQRGETLLSLIRERTDKPISTIIYTHAHPDHRGGAGALLADDPAVIAMAPIRPPLAYTERVANILNKRGRRQFGYDLDDGEIITQGLGPREGHTHSDPYRFVPPTRIVYQPSETLEIGGVEMELILAPGETDDTTYVWFPQYRVVCSADNYYACWPNLHPIRGGQYRDIAAWIDSLSRLLDLEADALLPGHFQPILGANAVRERITSYRDAIAYVFDQTLKQIDAGVSMDEVGRDTVLPAHLRDLPFLREHYGTIAWSAKAIFTGYVGWFDGNPSNLRPLSTVDRSTRLITAMGGRQQVHSMIEEALASGDDQWAMELCDHLLNVQSTDRDALAMKAQAMLHMAKHEINATARNYYTSMAREILDVIE